MSGAPSAFTRTAPIRKGRIGPDALLKHVDHPKVIGIGEAGLDYFHKNSTPENQAAGFRAHIEACRQSGLPLIVHTRDADEDTLAIMKDELKNGRYEAVIHCYSSSPALGYEAVELGFYLGLGGILTFKRSEELRETVANIPLDRILLETDSPYLAPEPYRGKKNEPAYVAHVAAKLAEVKQVSVGEIETGDDGQLFSAVQQGRSSGCLTSSHRPAEVSGDARSRPRSHPWVWDVLGCADDRVQVRRLPIDRSSQQAPPLRHRDPERRYDHPGGHAAGAAAAMRGGRHRSGRRAALHPCACRSRQRPRRHAQPEQRDGPPDRHHRRCQRARKNPFPLRLRLPAAGAGKRLVAPLPEPDSDGRPLHGRRHAGAPDRTAARPRQELGFSYRQFCLLHRHQRLPTGVLRQFCLRTDTNGFPPGAFDSTDTNG